MDASGLVANKMEIVGTAKHRLFVTGIAILCFTLILFLIHSKHFGEKAMLEEVSKRDWLSDLFGAPPSDPATETKTTSEAAGTTVAATEDPFDSWFESLFEPGLDQNTTIPKADEAVANSSMTAANSTTPGSTTTSANSTTPGSTTTSANSTAPGSTTTSTQTHDISTTTITTSEASTPAANSSSSPKTSNTSEGTTLPACAEPNFRLAKICIIPDQLQQQKNFNITYQDFVDAVKSAEAVKFWEGCQHDDPCRPGGHVKHMVNGLAETWINGNSKAQLCPWMDCLQVINASDEYCMKDKEGIFNMTQMMCSFDFHITKEDRKCAGDVIGMLNRNMADEQERNPNNSTKRCHNTFFPCQTACKKQYEDMTTMFDVTCLKYTTTLKRFYPWYWFSKHKAEIKTSCHIESAALVKDSEGHGFNYYDELIKDKGLVAGIVLSCVVTLIALLVLSAVFVKRVKRGRYYDREGVEYSEVTGLMAAPDEPDKHHF